MAIRPPTTHRDRRGAARREPPPIGRWSGDSRRQPPSARDPIDAIVRPAHPPPRRAPHLPRPASRRRVSTPVPQARSNRGTP